MGDEQSIPVGHGIGVVGGYFHAAQAARVGWALDHRFVLVQLFLVLLVEHFLLEAVAVLQAIEVPVRAIRIA
ncbi:hypothetical protein KI385_02795 [Streptomyces inhibens]|nr:hypothetical protein [Streptomyces inhibens]UKY47859.1 hypothetical protein KI385_02795 [Streptomyces inhibens]